MRQSSETADRGMLDTGSARAAASFILPLTGIRGLAAIWVVLFHLRGRLGQAVPTWDAFLAVIDNGYLGVDLFAFLSGFIMSHTYGDRLARSSAGEAGRYLWARLARIYPLHLFVLALFVVSAVWSQSVGSLAQVAEDERFWRQLFLLNGTALEDSFAWNGPSWTVSSEWFCYLAFPLFAPLLSRVKRAEVAGALAISTLGLTAYVMVAVGRPWIYAFPSWGLARIGGGFLVGCWLYRAYRAGLGRELPWGWIGLVSLICGIGFSNLLPAASVACFAVLVYALAHDRDPLRKVFGSRPAVWLGEISYSIYMLHWFVLTVGVTLMGEAADQLAPGALVWLLLALVIAGSALTYTFVERPARRHLRRIVDVRGGTRPAQG